ncbi:hypothetical protein A7U60_g7142 [Sanghuangporus baumii]|uniref:Sulfhydryl oxidase n=1 Tax=Sanghuangporus baumii TaxID=108892 RepID=A0A9Q5HTU2_SANBA|nr:hypothetical protein A7U60_g7142 [Sanghuangporus baumii]
MLPGRFTRTFVLVVLALIILTSLLMFHEPTRKTYFDPFTGYLFDSDGVQEDFVRARPVPVRPPIRPPVRPPALQETVVEQAKELQGVHGGVIIGKLGNETAKQALGRATWKLLHTMTLRFPENPTEDERNALESYFHLLSRLYPCGECAAEFQKLLQKYPPQTSSRRAAALWLCHLHNQVNKRLKKDEFDCAHLDETYDCGCGDAPIMEKPEGGKKIVQEGERDELTGAAIIKGGR